MAEMWGLLFPFLGMGTHVAQCRLGRGYGRTNWHLDPTRSLAITDRHAWAEIEGRLCPFMEGSRVPI